MTKLIIFDFDGVIINGSNEGYFNCYHKALETVGIKLNPNEERKRILLYWGKGYKKQLELLLKEHKELIEKSIKAYEHFYYQTDTFTKKIQLIYGAKNTLKNLSRKYQLAIASGMMKKTMMGLINKFKIHFFEKIITIDDIKKEEDKKPSPYMINKIMQHFSVSKEETVYVGDAKNDVEMARNAGVKPIVVLTGHLTKNEASQLNVEYIIADITYLEQALKLI